MELKVRGTVQSTHNLLKEFLKGGKWNADQFLISSFDWEKLKHFYKLNKVVPIAVLNDAEPLEAITIASILKAKAINPNHINLNENNVKKIQ